MRIRVVIKRGMHTVEILEGTIDHKFTSKTLEDEFYWELLNVERMLNTQTKLRFHVEEVD